MWSEALRILDENSLKYYVEELKEELEKKKLREQEIDVAIKQREETIRQKDIEIDKLKKEIEAIKEQLGMKY